MGLLLLIKLFQNPVPERAQAPPGRPGTVPAFARPVNYDLERSDNLLENGIHIN